MADTHGNRARLEDENVTMPPHDGRGFRVALDAMGGDNAPAEIVKGGIAAARDGATVFLVGVPERVQAELDKEDVSGLALQIVPSDDAIEETEQPALAFRRKPKASVLIATGLVKEGMADAVVSMGSTGALMASAHFLLGTLENLDRPVLGGPALGYAPNTIWLDMGGNVDARPAQFLDFAAIGVATARAYLEVDNPSVALLNVGEEPTKGSKQVKEAYTVLQQQPHLNFIGNVEAHEAVQGKANVVLADGFVGNALLKYSEGLGQAIAKDLGERLAPELGPEKARAIAMDIFRKINRMETAGGPILGVNGIVIVGHGRARAPMVHGAIRTAQLLKDHGVVEAIKNELNAIHMRNKTEAPAASSGA